jgi:hypothetical protein
VVTPWVAEVVVIFFCPLSLVAGISLVAHCTFRAAWCVVPAADSQTEV